MTWKALLKQSSVLALVLGLLAWGPLETQAQDRIPENTLAVQGMGSVTAQPDSFQLMLGVVTEAPTVEAARSQNAERMNTILQRLRALNIPKLTLQTSGFSVEPIREVQQEPTPYRRQVPDRIIGYRVHNNINARVEGSDPNRLASDASRIIDTALAAGANTVSGISFSLSREHPTQRQALQLAIQQARLHAEAAAQAAGVRLTGIYSIEAYAQGIPMRAVPMAAEMAEARVPTPIEPGELDVTANVTIRFDFQD